MRVGEEKGGKMQVGGGGGRGRQLNYFLFIFTTRFEGDELRFRLRAFLF